MKKPIKLHWSSSKPNFGDALSPMICEVVSGRKVQHAKPNHCDLISIGSILHRAKEGFFSKKIHVWGSGYIENQSPKKSKHYYHAVRGELTKKIIDKAPAALGDPGLLAFLLLNKSISKKYKIGFVEHYKDKRNTTILEILDKTPNSIYIDVFLPPATFLERISECEIIFSSAMHGLIAADSLGIPNAWIELSENLRGHGFKFQDYYSVFNINVEPRLIDVTNVLTTVEDVFGSYSRPNIEEIKKQLYDSFPQDI
jgi:hypothetical protein